MNIQAALQPDSSFDILKGIQRILQDGSASCCGVIVARSTLGAHDLRRMETLLGLEDHSLQPQFLYERESGILAILLKGKKLSETHLLSLFLKQFLENDDLLGSSMMVMSFPECGEPQNFDLSSLLYRLALQRSKEHAIVICHDDMDESNPSTILIIDDDPNACELLNLRLQMKGYEVHTADNGRAGIGLCEKLSPDVVITELALPVCDGYQVIRSIQQNEELDSKIMVLTAHRLEEDISACFDLGVADYVKKPFSPVEVEARIRRLLV